ncbi:MAG: hypothetical protein K1Y02_26365 [Candidatus Hydrogenedentes bacterium]|jgi:hypothetical protein|nr:hypothetical protein [Candidatus Hydrogenedentota bacterium]HNV26973.1 hypothetical protein [Nitrospira sp.]HRC43291.1 hypothetical protein [Nitrospira sp.]
MTGKRVLVTGLHPSAVDFSNYPGWTADRLTASLDSEQATLRELGYSPDACWFNLKQPPESVLQKKLAEGPFDCVMIGAGVRTNQDHFLMFEKLINTVHQYAPHAKICFNTNPTDTAAAVQRWV